MSSSSDVRFLSAQVSIFYHYVDIKSLDLDHITSVARGKYLPPVYMESPGSEALLVLVSENGNSQIIFTSSSVALNVAYSRQWQRDPEQGERYVAERLPLLLDLLARLDGQSIIYAGCSIGCQIPTERDDAAVTDAVGEFIGTVPEGDVTDLAIKYSETVDQSYYRNVTVNNFRTFVAGPQTPPQIRLKNSTASERGVEVSVEVNSRYAYNEGQSLSVTLPEVMKIVHAAFSEASSISSTIAKEMNK